MENYLRKAAPCPRQLLSTLEARFDYHWIATEDESLWQLHFPLHLIELDHSSFRINISIIASRNGRAEDLQHMAYLELIGSGSDLLLRWSEGIISTLEQATTAFQSIYPLEQFVVDIRHALSDWNIDVPAALKLSVLRTAQNRR